jgi:CHAT domain-containing protein/Tfp pilus assembly protein PilF
MHGFRVAAAILALGVVCPVVCRAQAVADSAAAAARQLRASTRPGEEDTLPCDRVDQDVARALILASQQNRSEPFDQLKHGLLLAVRAGRCAGSDAIVGAALNELSDVLLGLGDFDGALATGRESVATPQRLHDDPGMAEAWNRVGNAEAWQNDIPAAMDAFHQALDISTAAGDRVGQARAWNNLANACRNLGELEQGLDYLHRALNVFEEIGDDRRAAVVTNNIGLIYFNRGDYAQALEYNERGLRLNRAAGAESRLAASLDSRANIYRALGAYRPALENFQQALALRVKTGDVAGVMETTHNIGLVHLSQGDYELAIDAFKRGLRLNRELHDDSLEAEALLNIGAAAWRLGQADRAAANLRAGLAISRARGLKSLQAEATTDLGEIALAHQRHAEAVRLFEESLAISRSIPDEAGVSLVTIRLASVRLAQRQFGEASVLAEQALANTRLHDQPELLWQAQTVAGMALLGLGRASARTTLNDAIASIERLASQTTGGENLRQRFMDDKLSPYQELVAIDVQEQHLTEAEEIAERSKARVLAQLVRGGLADEDSVLTADERRARNRLREAVGILTHQIDTTERRDGAARPALVDERTQAREALAAYETSLAAKHPELSRIRGTLAPATGEQLARLLGPRRAALEYVVSERRTIGMLLRLDAGGRLDVTARVIPAGATDLERLSTRLRQRIAGRDLEFAADARAMYDLLLRPFPWEATAPETLIVVPDGPLWSVPFQALLGPSGFVIETAAVSYAPSLTVLRDIVRLPPRSGPPTLLAIGKADFGTSPGPSLPNLPQAEAQVRQIAALYGPRRASVLVGAAATEAGFKRTAPQYSVLHLATHGILDESSPMYSHLVLTPDPDSPEDDGRLEAWELMRLHLSADLVVLAACDTARGQLLAGEGVIGTMWALLAAGARSMVVSQFPVEAGSASTLLTAFHRGIVSGTGGKAADLRAAALQLLHTPKYSHPYYWAAFVLVGDPD